MNEGSAERKVLGGRKGFIGIAWEVGVMHVMTIWEGEGNGQVTRGEREGKRPRRGLTCE